MVWLQISFLTLQEILNETRKYKKYIYIEEGLYPLWYMYMRVKFIVSSYKTYLTILSKIIYIHICNNINDINEDKQDAYRWAINPVGCLYTYLFHIVGISFNLKMGIVFILCKSTIHFFNILTRISIVFLLGLHILSQPFRNSSRHGTGYFECDYSGTA